MSSFSGPTARLSTSSAIDEFLWYCELAPDEPRRLRRYAGMSAEEFGRTLSVSASAIYHWEAGLRRPTPMERLLAYSRALHRIHDQRERTRASLEEERARRSLEVGLCPSCERPWPAVDDNDSARSP